MKKGIHLSNVNSVALKHIIQHTIHGWYFILKIRIILAIN